jgi:hypothetical protein
MTAGIVKLTKQKFFAFVEDRLDGAGPCRVQEDLPFAALADTSVLPNARLFMMMLDDSGKKLKARGNLNRKFVEILLDRFQWQDCDAAEIRSVCKKVNEQDVTPAMYLHAVLRLAGLRPRPCRQTIHIGRANGRCFPSACCRSQCMVEVEIE